jgi:hypothetical protein
MGKSYLKGMSPCITYSIVHRKDEWHVLKEGIQEPQGRFKNKPDAVDRGKALAMAEEVSRLRIGMADGSIQSEITFAKDPGALEGAPVRRT